MLIRCSSKSPPKAHLIHGTVLDVSFLGSPTPALAMVTAEHIAPGFRCKDREYSSNDPCKSFQKLPCRRPWHYFSLSIGWALSPVWKQSVDSSVEPQGRTGLCLGAMLVLYKGFARAHVREWGRNQHLSGKSDSYPLTEWNGQNYLHYLNVLSLSLSQFSLTKHMAVYSMAGYNMADTDRTGLWSRIPRFQSHKPFRDC